MSSTRSRNWHPDTGVVVRTPMLPLTLLDDWRHAASTRAFLGDLLGVPEIDEALFVASPDLHGMIATWRAEPDSLAGQRIERSLCKYIARMAGRATPFGLFSGVSAGTLGARTSLELAPRANYRRRTRLDNDYLFALARSLARDSALRERLVYRPNSSIYALAGSLRFAATLLDGEDRRYHLVSIEPTPHVEATLARAAKGARPAELAQALVAPDISLADARAFIDELVDRQLLVPDLGIQVTGPEPIDGLLAQLRAAEITDPLSVLEAARAAIAAIDAQGVGSSPERYRAVASSLEVLPAKVHLARLFQVDMVKPAAITIGHRVAADLLAVAERMVQISPHNEDAQSLDDFRRAFVERWGDREVPLAEALDEESGIGFAAARGPGSEGSPLLSGLELAPEPKVPRIEWRPMDQLMMTRLCEALSAQATEIVLTDSDLDAMKHVRVARLPDAVAVIARLEASPEQLARNEVTALFESCYGPAGTRLLGRFCHASPEIDAMVRSHHAAEERLRPGAVFAEVVYLTEGRIGNIVCRPVLRDHEITYLGFSGAAPDRRITLDDLWVSVRDAQIALRSHRLGREVVPRMATAHSYRRRSQGVYRFLCALGSQDIDNAVFGLGVLGRAPFVPRIRYGRVVLSRARWNLSPSDVSPITRAVRDSAKQRAASSQIADAVAALRARMRLPRFVVISVGDNQLPIDLDNPMLVAAFADEVAGTGARLHEMFPAPDRLIVHGPEGGFTNEVVITFCREATDRASVETVPVPTARRRFAPGSEWLQAEIACGISTMDRVLVDEVAPLVREASDAGDVDRWWFSRADGYLRVAFHGDPSKLLANLVPSLERTIDGLVAARIARGLVLQPYDRDLERLGGDGAIDLVEQVFWHDSEAVLAILELLDPATAADERWRLALRGIDSLLDALGLAAERREAVIGQARDRLGRELHADTAFWSRVGDRFTKQRPSLDLLFDRDPARDAESPLEPGFQILAERDTKVAALAAELGAAIVPDREQIMWNIVESHANRLLNASHRAQEIVLLGFLRRLYASRRARSKPT